MNISNTLFTAIVTFIFTRFFYLRQVERSRDGQNSWRIIGQKLSNEILHERYLQRVLHRVKDNLTESLKLSQDKYNEIIVGIWGAPPIDRRPSDVLAIIESQKHTSAGLARVVIGQDFSLKSLRKQLDEADEAAAKWKQQASDNANLLVILMENGWCVTEDPATAGYFSVFDCTLKDMPTIAHGSTPEKAILKAQADKQTQTTAIAAGTTCGSAVALAAIACAIQ